MPSNDAEWKEVERRLKNLVDCISTQAKADPSFCEELKKILFSDEIRSKLSSRKEPRKRPAPGFEIVEFLRTQGADSLARELGQKSLTELQVIIRQHTVLDPKPMRAKDHNGLVNALVDFAKKKLAQGTGFIQSSIPEPLPETPELHPPKSSLDEVPPEPVTSSDDSTSLHMS